MGWTRIPYLFLKIPESKWGGGNPHFSPSAVKEQIVHLFEGCNDLANFSLLPFHALGIGANYTRGTGLPGAPSQMLSLPPLSLATHCLLSELTCGTSRAQSYAWPFLGLDTVICQITQQANKSSRGWLYFAHGLLQHMVPSVVERGLGGGGRTVSLDSDCLMPPPKCHTNCHALKSTGSAWLEFMDFIRKIKVGIESCWSQDGRAGWQHLETYSLIGLIIFHRKKKWMQKA